MTWPFAVLVVDSDSINLRGPLGGAEFRKPQRVLISTPDGLTATGVRFAPEDLRSNAVTFSTRRCDDVVRGLRALGWQVEG